MIVQIRDRAALSSLSLVSLRAYLVSREWKNEGQWGERPVTIFAKESGGRTWEIPVPKRDTIGGYAEGMAEAVAVLAAVEERSQLDVFFDLRGAGADVIRVISANGLSKEPLSLGQSATLLNDAYKMLAASARAVERPQAAYRGKASANVERILNKIQPLPISQGYALTLHSPVAVEIGTVTTSDFRGLHKLKKTTGERFASGVVLYDGEIATSFGDGMFAVPSHDEEIIAQIVQLAREPHEFDGRATIVSVWDDRTLRMNVEFHQSVYDMVINAFRDRSDISMLGDIHPSGRGYELRNPRNVLVVPDE